MTPLRVVFPALAVLGVIGASTTSLMWDRATATLTIPASFCAASASDYFCICSAGHAWNNRIIYVENLQCGF